MSTKLRTFKARKLSGTLPVIRRGEPQELASGFPVAHYSYSSMSKFSTNPIMFRIQYMNRDKIESTHNASGVLGTAFHKSMEVYYGGIEELKPKDESQAVEFGLKAGMEFLKEYNDGFIEFTDKMENKQALFDKFSFLFAAYVKEKPNNPGEVIISTEECIIETIDVEWRGHRLTLPVPLKGYLDKLVRHDGKLKIKDYKSCYSFSDPDKIDGEKIIQAIIYYFLVYAKYGEAPYSCTYEEVKWSLNSGKNAGKPQVQQYEIVYTDHEYFFDFFFRFYEDMTNGLNGKMVYVPNIKTMYDNEVSIVAYINRLDIPEEKAELMKEHQVSNITDLLKAKIQSAGSMRKLMKTVEEKFVSAKNLNYDSMQNHEKIKVKMMEHGMMLDHHSTIEGSAVDLFRYTPSIGLKMSRLATYVADVEQVLGISDVRVLAPIRGSSLVGFEVPRAVRRFPGRQSNRGFELAIGQNITGETRYFDLRQSPHTLVAGATGSGKSIFLNLIIQQLATIPNVQLHLYDPKMVEFNQYESIAQDYQSDHENITLALSYLVDEMNQRYRELQKAGVRSIAELPSMPYKFVIIDEFGDLVRSKETQDVVLLLSQKARAAGIHLILATQRPSVKIINGDIKANFPVKVAFHTAKESDSRIVLDEEGAEKLLGKGDMLFSTSDGIERLQGFNI